MLSWTNPAFLYAFGALALPVFIHLMRRSVAVDKHFPSIRFIMKGRLPKQGKRRLRDILLLLLRMLLLALLAALFSGPVWQPDITPPANQEESKNIVFYLDCSSSMSAADRLEKAKEKIRNYTSGRNNDRYALFTWPNPSEKERSFAGTATLFKALDNISIPPYEGNHDKGLNALFNSLSRTRIDELVLVSDFQEYDWQLKPTTKLASSTSLAFLDAGETIRNRAVVDVIPSRLAGNKLRLTATLRNYSIDPAKGTVSLQSGNQRMEKPFTIPPLGLSQTDFVVKDITSSKATISLSEDDYSADDSFLCWTGSPPPLRILVVAPFEEEPLKQTEFFFIQKALSVSLPNAQRTFVVEQLDASHFFAINTEAADGIILLGAAGYFEESSFESLKTFVEAGGSVLCTPGNAAGRQFTGLIRHGLFNASFNGISGIHKDNRSQVYIGNVNPDSIFGSLFDDAESDLFTFPIYKYVRLKEQLPAVSLITTADDTPVLLRQDIGKGSVYITTTAFVSAWSEWQLTTSFLPIIREPFIQAAADKPAVVKSICGLPVYSKSGLLGGNRSKLDIDTTQPTVQVIEEFPYQINVSRKESSQNKISLAFLRENLTEGTESAAKPSLSSSEKTIELWPWAAAAAILVLLLEHAAILITERETATAGKTK